MFGTKRLKGMGSDAGAVLKGFKQSLYEESETESHTLKNKKGNFRMKKILFKSAFVALLSFSLFACNKKIDEQDANTKIQYEDTVLTIDAITLTPKKDTERWYFSEQAERGKIVFSSNCVACHGRKAEATPNWKTPNDNGHYPPPPLNGTAHAWHHPISVLGRTIYSGGAAVGGQMPAFKNRLSESEIIDVIAHIQTYWPDKIYGRWLTMEKSSRRQ
ncbi:MAG: mono/diheme cytochrome c family protein [Granulosicoccus sp.]